MSLVKIYDGEAGSRATAIYEAERAVLGSVLLDEHSLSTVRRILGDDSDSFADDGLRLIYEAMIILNKTQEAIDGITLKNILSGMNKLDIVGGIAFIADLSSSVPTSANVEYYAKIVYEASQRRYLGELIKKTEAMLNNGEPIETLLASWRGFDASVDDNTGSQSVFEIGRVYRSYINDIVDKVPKAQRLSIGFDTLDRLTMGYGPGNVAIIAARPGRGKTALVINITRNVGVERGKHVLFFTLEMPILEIYNRLVACTGNTATNNLRSGYDVDATKAQMDAASKRIEACEIHFQDTGCSSIDDLCASIVRHISTLGMPDLIIIDYLQLLTASSRRSENRQQEITIISRQVKKTAMDLGVPFIVVSQLRRLQDSESDAKPRLSHLRESGSIEQDADTVLLLHRLNVSQKFILEANLAKNRHGEEGSFQIEFDVQHQNMWEVGNGRAE